MAERLDLTSAALDAFDGVVGPLSDYWRHFSERGLSPTALETYGRCPFQFFARYVLGLERLERPEEMMGPSPAEFGELGHLILKLIYQELIDQDCFSRQEPRCHGYRIDIDDYRAAGFRRTCIKQSRRLPSGLGNPPGRPHCNCFAKSWLEISRRSPSQDTFPSLSRSTPKSSWERIGRSR